MPSTDLKLRGALCDIDLVGIPVLMRIMRDREPMQVKGIAALHNAILFFLSLYMVTETLYQVLILDASCMRTACTALIF